MVSNFKLLQFDFTGKRVKFDGVVQSKFELSFLIGCFDPFSCFSIYPDAYLYHEYAAKLKELVLFKLS